MLQNPSYHTNLDRHISFDYQFSGNQNVSMKSQKLILKKPALFAQLFL